jgi:hypothetical protein
MKLLDKRIPGVMGMGGKAEPIVKCSLIFISIGQSLFPRATADQADSIRTITTAQQPMAISQGLLYFQTKNWSATFIWNDIHVCENRSGQISCS